MSSNNIVTHIIDGFIVEESQHSFMPDTEPWLNSYRLQKIRQHQIDVINQERIKIESLECSLWSDEADIDEISSLGVCRQCGESIMDTAGILSMPKAEYALQLCSICSESTLNSNEFSHRRKSVSRPTKRTRPYGCGRGKSTRGKGRKRMGGSSSVFRKNDLSEGDCDSDSDLHVPSSSSDPFSSESPVTSPEPALPLDKEKAGRPMSWDVEDVWRFMLSLPDGATYAEDFRIQEIDGSALMLLHEEHLVNSMNFPLGPALKVCAHIDKLRRTESDALAGDGY